MRARLRWTEEVWNRSVDQACLASWAVDECRKNPKASTWQCWTCLLTNLFQDLFALFDWCAKSYHRLHTYPEGHRCHVVEHDWWISGRDTLNCEVGMFCFGCFMLGLFLFDLPSSGRLQHLRDYSQDLDSVLLTKPTRLVPDMLAMVQDHVIKPVAKGAGLTSLGAADPTEVEDAEDIVWANVWTTMFKPNTLWPQPWNHSLHQEALRTAEYGVACANLAHDYKEAVNFNLRRSKEWVEQIYVSPKSKKTHSLQVDGSRHVAQAFWLITLCIMFFCLDGVTLSLSHSFKGYPVKSMLWKHTKDCGRIICLMMCLSIYPKRGLLIGMYVFMNSFTSSLIHQSFIHLFIYSLAWLFSK